MIDNLTDEQIEVLALHMRKAIWGEQSKAEWEKVKTGYVQNFRDWLAAIRRLGYQVVR